MSKQAIVECPACKNQIQFTVSFASGPRQSTLTPVSASTDNLRELMETVNAISLDSMNDFERKFVTDLRERYEQYAEKTRMSEKQMSVLRKIAGEEF